ncbi:hypothetical protein BT69DRAFT_1291917 [Atractiella rhizophila]|nr:hypothetical protein BT69DRAFT_1291917 [Atractiella rhizophila]
MVKLLLDPLDECCLDLWIVTMCRFFVAKFSDLSASFRILCLSLNLFKSHVAKRKSSKEHSPKGLLLSIPSIYETHAIAEARPQAPRISRRDDGVPLELDGPTLDLLLQLAKAVNLNLAPKKNLLHSFAGHLSQGSHYSPGDDKVVPAIEEVGL